MTCFDPFVWLRLPFVKEYAWMLQSAAVQYEFYWYDEEGNRL